MTQARDQQSDANQTELLSWPIDENVTAFIWGPDLK